jgi:hypothetical protein
VASPKWSRRTGWMVLVIAALCALMLAGLVGTAALDKETGAWAKAFLFVIGATALLAALMLSEGAAWDARHWTAWLQPRPLAALFLAIFIAFGVMTDALSLFEPRPAVESEPGVIEEGVNRIREDLRQAKAQRDPPHPRIAQRISGLWGEPGCSVAYRFLLRNEALIVDAERRPPGAPPYRLVASITSSEGDVLQAVGEQPYAARGKAATFTYFTNGAIERLTWDDQVSPVPLELDRCG